MSIDLTVLSQLFCSVKYVSWRKCVRTVTSSKIFLEPKDFRPDYI